MPRHMPVRAVASRQIRPDLGARMKFNVQLSAVPWRRKESHNLSDLPWRRHDYKHRTP